MRKELELANFGFKREVLRNKLKQIYTDFFKKFCVDCFKQILLGYSVYTIKFKEEFFEKEYGVKEVCHLVCEQCAIDKKIVIGCQFKKD